MALKITPSAPRVVEPNRTAAPRPPVKASAPAAQTPSSRVRDTYYADKFEGAPDVAAKPKGIFDSIIDAIKGLFGLNGTSAATAPAQTSAPAAPVDQDKVEQAARMVNSAADLVNILGGSGLNQAEKDALVAKLARDPNKQMCLFGDVERMSPEDQAVIAKAIGAAVSSGAMTDKDLLALADYDQSGMGPARFAQLLALDPSNLQPGGAAERLGQALWARSAGATGTAAENDRAAAALIFTSSPELMARNLDTPQKREEAFTSLTNYLDQASTKVPGPLLDKFKQDAVAGLANLFKAHGPELMRGLTADGNPGGGVVLSKFFADVYLAPEGKAFAKDIEDTLRQTASGLMKDMNTSDESARQLATRQLARIAASVNGGGVIVIDRYRKELAANKDRVDQLAGLLGGAIGALLPEVGVPTGAAVDALSKAIAEAILHDPDRPDVALGTMYATFQQKLHDYEKTIGHGDLVSAFDGEYAAELAYIREQLELNYA